MAFLSSFRIGQHTVYPEELHERLKSFALLENVGDAALRNLLADANWFALPGGMMLARGGENRAALFLVVTGSLGVFVSDEQGQRHMVALIPAGETVGEMSLIAGSSNHNAQLVALRDTELLRISPDGFAVRGRSGIQPGRLGNRGPALPAGDHAARVLHLAQPRARPRRRRPQLAGLRLSEVRQSRRRVPAVRQGAGHQPEASRRARVHGRGLPDD